MIFENVQSQDADVHLYGLREQTVNLLCALETVALLLAGGPDAKPGKDANIVANQTLFAQVLLVPISGR